VDNEIGGTAYVNPATGQANDPTGDKGTVTPVFVVPPLGNTISGNPGYGLAITGHAYRNLVMRSCIGAEILGTSARQVPG
jgi:hypothetical protein